MTYKIPFLYDYVFANMILPNAISSEMAMINYTFTKYNAGQHYYSVFDKELGSSNGVLGKVFGNHYQDWPPCVRGHGPHLNNKAYHSHLEIIEDSLYFGKKKYKKYIYPILVGPHFKLFVGQGPLGSKINGEHFWKNISAEVLDDVRNGDAFIFLDWAHECLLTRESYIMLHESIAHSGIPSRQIIFAHNSFNAKELYETWFEPTERKITVLDWPFLMFMISYHYRTKPEYRITEASFHESRNKKREHHFLFRNRRAHFHRCAVLYRLYEEEILDKGDWSMLESVDSDRFINGLKFHNIPINFDLCKSLTPQFPKNLKLENASRFENVGGWSDTNSIPSTEVYFDITSETLFDTHYKSMTEKISKPLINFLPFVLIGAPGLLQQLRAIGFKTFHPFINESYDLERDPNKRLAMIVEEIKKLCAMSKDEIHRWYWNMEGILMHNHRTMLAFHTNDPINLNLIKYLDNCVN
jgi:hypothetical protein